MRFNYEAVNMSVITSYIFIITNPVVRQNFGALLSHKVMYNLNFFNF